MRNTLRLFISCYIDIMQTSAPTVHILWNYIFILAAKLATKKQSPLLYSTMATTAYVYCNYIIVFIL